MPPSSMKLEIVQCLYVYRHAPNKRWHVDTVMKVLTTVRPHFFMTSCILALTFCLVSSYCLDFIG